MRNDRDRLLDILNAIDRVLEKALAERASFERDEMLQVFMSIKSMFLLYVEGQIRRLHPGGINPRHERMRVVPPDEGNVGLLRYLRVHAHRPVRRVYQ